MGSLFRSEEMALCQLFIQSESAYGCVSELGELGIIQFRDLNSDVNAFQRKFVHEVRKCDDMEHKLQYLETEMLKDDILFITAGQNYEAPMPKEMIDLEAQLEKLDSEMQAVNKNAETLKRNFLELTELSHILKKTQVFFDEALYPSTMPYDQDVYYDDDETINLLTDTSLHSLKHIGFVAGVISREKLPSFERLLWRLCQGNVFLRQSEINESLEDPKTGDSISKSVFIIFFQGEQLKLRIKKICEAFHATIYPCPEAPAERREIAIKVKTQMEDLTTVLNQTKVHRNRVLVAAGRNIHIWRIKLCKMKAIYHTLNCFSIDVIRNGLIAECWLPVHDQDIVSQALRRATEKSGSMPVILNRLNMTEQPPTFHRTNKYTIGFQALIDAYGVATYREINPTPFTIITFPFLFAVMFGDVGHGLIMTLFGAWMVLRERNLSNKYRDSEIWTIFFGGRYIILLMGLFSMYTGLIYNDVFSKAINLFGSSWHPNYTISTLSSNKELTLNPTNISHYEGIPYPFGLDPMWQLATNKINFYNSYKMKISIIFGIVHMLFGTTLSIANHRYFRQQLNIYCEFIPQILFLSCLFVYLVLLVIHKWIWYGGVGSVGVNSPGCAPSVLMTFINMRRYSGHEISTTERGSNAIEDEDMSEILIYQGIHTIEYVLGSVSHTASYLRLWALSLAHAQLSEVLWMMVLRIGLASGGSVVLYGIFAIWSVLTLSILVLMEGLSAFLHTLRLHWVEFQSKFYKGSGYAFVPFSFHAIIEDMRKVD